MTRTYNSSRRTKQAAQTREEVMAAAARLFAETGWAATTIAAVAKEAGVAVETIYAGFGSKKALLLAAADASVVGDAAPIPLAERPEFARLGEGTPEERVAAGIDLVVETAGRSAAVWRAIEEAAAGDPEIDAWRVATDTRRRIDVVRGTELVLGHPIDPVTADLLWVLFAPSTYNRLVHDLGLSIDEYRERLAVGITKLTGVRLRR